MLRLKYLSNFKLDLPNSIINCDLAQRFVSQPLAQTSTAPPGRGNGPHPVETLDLSGENNLTSPLVKTQEVELGKGGQSCCFDSEKSTPLYSFMLFAAVCPGYWTGVHSQLSRLPRLSRATIRPGWDIACLPLPSQLSLSTSCHVPRCSYSCDTGESYTAEYEPRIYKLFCGIR